MDTYFRPPSEGQRTATLRLSLYSLRSEVKGPVMDSLSRLHYLGELTGRVHLAQFDAISSINPVLARRTLGGNSRSVMWRFPEEE